MERPATPATPLLTVVPLADLFTVASEYERTGRLDDAERMIGHMLATAPHLAELLHLGGIVAFRRKQPLLALARMEAAIRYGIDTPLYLRNICEVYRTLNRLDDALAAGQRACRLAPNDPLSLHNLAVIQYERMELDACIASARAALAIDPHLAGAHFQLAEALLLRGEWRQGWDEYEWRFRIANAAQPMPATGKPPWDGAPMDGRLLLVADQGFGDVMQFMRYIPWARRRCPHLVLASSKESAPLLARIAPGVPIITHWRDCPAYDASCTLSGLPRLHGTRTDSIPWDGAYITSDPARRQRWAARLTTLLPPDYKRVGVVWAGRPTHNNDRNRSTTLEALRPLALPGIVLVALQKGATAEQPARWFGRTPLVSLAPEIADYDDTAAILDNLDLLITVDTSVGHLAAAMNRPVWIMLPRAPDWRWLLDREDSPWYPSVRLFRQRDHGGWAEMMERAAAALAEHCAVAA